MEIDPTSAIQEMVETCRFLFSPPRFISLFIIRSADQNGMMGSMMQDLAFAIPGVDEAMGFAEIMKYAIILPQVSVGGRTDFPPQTCQVDGIRCHSF